MAKQTSQFRFFKSRHVPELTVLRAAMSDFRYDPHAHDEYAFGVTLAGRQDFFSGGCFIAARPATSSSSIPARCTTASRAATARWAT